METKISAWGGSLAVRIPKKALDELQLLKGDCVNLEVKNGAIFIKKADRKKRFEDLVQEMKTSKQDPFDDYGSMGQEML